MEISGGGGERGRQRETDTERDRDTERTDFKIKMYNVSRPQIRLLGQSTLPLPVWFHSTSYCPGKIYWFTFTFDYSISIWPH